MKWKIRGTEKVKLEGNRKHRIIEDIRMPEGVQHIKIYLDIMFEFEVVYFTTKLDICFVQCKTKQLLVLISHRETDRHSGRNHLGRDRQTNRCSSKHLVLPDPNIWQIEALKKKLNFIHNNSSAVNSIQESSWQDLSERGLQKSKILMVFKS